MRTTNATKAEHDPHGRLGVVADNLSPVQDWNRNKDSQD